jgi:hypothetical protein
MYGPSKHNDEAGICNLKLKLHFEFRSKFKIDNTTYRNIRTTMARTKQTARCEAPNTTTSATSYNSMSNAELKKIIDERKIEGRSKLTLKTAMIEALTFQDENPEDKKGLAELISKYNKPKKDTSDSERGSRTESSAKSETSTKKSSGSESSSGGKKSESKSSEPKVKKSKKTDWLEEHGINRNEYPPGTRFTKSKMGKIKVHFPKDYEISEDEKESLEVKILSVNEQIKEPKVEPKLIVRRVPSKQSQEPDELDDIPLVKKSKVSKPAPKIVDPDETEEEDPRVIEMKRKEIEAMKKKQLLDQQVESITTTLFGIDISNDPMEEDQDTNSSDVKSSQKRQREEPKREKEREKEREPEDETEEESMTQREDEESQEPESEFFQKGYISLKRQQSKEISELCGKMMEHIKYFDLNGDEYEDKEKLIKVLKKMDSIFNKIK